MASGVVTVGRAVSMSAVGFTKIGRSAAASIAAPGSTAWGKKQNDLIALVLSLIYRSCPLKDEPSR